MKRIAQHIIATILVIGALNWGLMGLFDVNLVELLFGESSFLTRVIYTIVGISGLLFAVLEANEHKYETAS